HAIVQSAGMDVRSLIVCAAGPLRGRSVKLTNANWELDGPALASQLGLQQGLLLNDFEALALSLPSIRPEWTRPIGSVEPVTGPPMIVLGPGTGLGAAALVRAGESFLGLQTEAGHTDFAAVDDDERSIWELLRKVHRRITPETVLSGSGLVRLQAARDAILTGSSYCEPDTSDAAAAHVTAAAMAEPDGSEAATVRLFWRLVARCAGDLTLTYFAQGGVTLAGGILPRIAPLLDEAAFREAFEDKQPMRGLLKAAPVRLLLRSDAVHHGMAALAERPDAYLLNYAGRCWR
ncbi:MAG: glucokinase, partial [Hyphomicrobiales bacterium]|nr:glucokinase [Hyphomicrobiales bacterium]